MNTVNDPLVTKSSTTTVLAAPKVLRPTITTTPTTSITKTTPIEPSGAEPVHHHHHHQHHLKRVTFGLPTNNESNLRGGTAIGCICNADDADRQAELLPPSRRRCASPPPPDIHCTPSSAISRSSRSLSSTPPSESFPLDTLFVSSSAGSSFSSTASSAPSSTASSTTPFIAASHHTNSGSRPSSAVPPSSSSFASKSKWLLPGAVCSSIMTLMKRCISEVSMIMFRATHSGDHAWREEYNK